MGADMTLSPLRVPQLCAGLLVSLLAISACSGDPAEGTLISTSRELTPADCAAVIPDAVVESFGWGAADFATVDLGSCRREAMRSPSSITVGTRVVPAPADEKAEAVQDAYDNLCVLLPPADLDSDATACGGVLDPGEEMGTVDLFLLTSDGELVEITVAVLTPTDAVELQAGMSQLVEAAEASF